MNEIVICLAGCCIFLIIAIIWWRKNFSISSSMCEIDKFNAVEKSLFKSNVSREAYMAVCDKMVDCTYSSEREELRAHKEIEEADLEARLKAEHEVLAEKVRSYRFGINLEMMSFLMDRVRREHRLVEKIVSCQDEERSIKILFNHVGLKSDDYNKYYDLMRKIVTNLKNN